MVKKRHHGQALIAYNNGQNLELLIETIRQKLLVLNVILAFLDHLKPEICSSANHGGQHLASCAFQNLWIRLFGEKSFCSCYFRRFASRFYSNKVAKPEVYFGLYESLLL